MPASIFLSLCADFKQPGGNILNAVSALGREHAPGKVRLAAIRAVFSCDGRSAAEHIIAGLRVCESA
jgi:hypothetical protein